VEAKAVEAKLVKSLGDLPEYRTVNMKEQSVLATQFLKDNPKIALKIAKGETIAPNNILPESIFTAVENQALSKGDVAVLKDLAQSNLVTEATAMGQRIRALAERDPDSSVSVMKDVIKTRTNRAIQKFKDVKAVKEAVKTEIKTELKATAPKVKDWETFIKNLTCK